MRADVLNKGLGANPWLTFANKLASILEQFINFSVEEFDAIEHLSQGIPFQCRAKTMIALKDFLIESNLRERKRQIFYLSIRQHLDRLRIK